MSRSIPLMAVLIFLAGCGSPVQTTDPAGGPAIPGSTPVNSQLYAYTAYDAGGVAVVSGELTLRFSDPDPEGTISISGTWSTRRVGGDGPVGPQVGTGKLAGSVSGAGEIQIDLNPGWADNNVLLFAHGKPSKFSDFVGTWSRETFIGPLAGGSFRALLR